MRTDAPSTSRHGGTPSIGRRSRTTSRRPRRESHLPPAETIHRVIVHHADRLHVGVADGAANETEPAPFEVATPSGRSGHWLWRIPPSGGCVRCRGWPGVPLLSPHRNRPP